MQAIETKYLGPTNFKGSRIKAQCAAKTIYLPYHPEISIEENHILAAYRLACELKWDKYWKPSTMASGVLLNGHYVHCVKEELCATS